MSIRRRRHDPTEMAAAPPPPPQHHSPNSSPTIDRSVCCRRCSDPRGPPRAPALPHLFYMHYTGPAPIRLALDSRKLAISLTVLYLRFEISKGTRGWGSDACRNASHEKNRHRFTDSIAGRRHQGRWCHRAAPAPPLQSTGDLSGNFLQ